MSDYFEPPLPGKRLPVDENTKDIIRIFQKCFNTSFADGKIKEPTFLSLLEGTILQDITIFHSERFTSYENLYFLYGERKEILFKAHPQQISYYLENIPPWYSFNHYVFDADLKWCISFDHNNVINLTGNL